jgi:hypothetical protein
MTGRILDGFDRAKVQVDLAKVTRLDSPTVERLLAGTPHVVKQNLDLVTADTYVRRLRAIGVECSAETEFLDLESQPLAQSPASVIPTPSSAVAAPVKGTQFAQPVRSGNSPKKPYSFWRGFWRGLGVLFLGLFVFLALFNDDGPFPIFAPAGKTSRPSEPQQAVSIREKTKEQQIADALSSIKRYDAKDYFSRRNRYEDLVALDPDNKEYKQQLDKYQKLYAADKSKAEAHGASRRSCQNTTKALLASINAVQAERDELCDAIGPIEGQHRFTVDTYTDLLQTGMLLRGIGYESPGMYLELLTVAGTRPASDLAIVSNAYIRSDQCLTPNMVAHDLGEALKQAKTDREKHLVIETYQNWDSDMFIMYLVMLG